jgi:hypothetical protein
MTGGTLMAVGRRNEPELSMASLAPQEVPNPVALVLQTLSAELTSLKRQVNTLVALRPGPSQWPRSSRQKSDLVTSQHVRPEQLRKVSD